MLTLPVWMLLAGCIDEPEPWTNQLNPDSPCYRVNLLDGLDESATTEVDDLFQCVNAHDHLDALEPTARLIETPTRSGAPIGIELAGLVNTMPSVDVDVFAIAGVLVDAMQADNRPIDPMLDIALELIYAEPATTVRSESFDLEQPSALEDGLLVPLGEVLPVGATALLDDPNDTRGWAAGVLTDAETKRWLRSVEGMASSPDPRVGAVLDDLLVHAGETLPLVRNASNDRWPAASGDSLRDLVEALATSDAPILVAVAPPAEAILSDTVVRTRLQDKLLVLHDQRHLQLLMPELKWMVDVDVNGRVVAGDEVSSLHAFIRLLANTNKPMRCSLDLWITNLEVNLGNLAVEILRVLADLDPGTVQTGTSVLGEVLGWDLSEWLVDEIAQSGVCPTLTPEVAHDLKAVDAISQPEAYDVLVVFVALMEVLERGQQDRIPEFADLAERLYINGGVEPAEELIRDGANAPLINDIIALIPILTDPAGHGIRAGDEPAADFQDLLSLAVWAFEVDPQTGKTGVERMKPLLEPIVEHDSTWTAIHKAAPLLADEQSQTSQALQLLPDLFALDPELVILDQLGPLLGDHRLSDPLLRMAEVPATTQTLLASETVEGQPQVPLAFGATLITDGTLDDLLAMIDLVFAALASE